MSQNKTKGGDEREIQLPNPHFEGGKERSNWVSPTIHVLFSRNDTADMCNQPVQVSGFSMYDEMTASHGTEVISKAAANGCFETTGTNCSVPGIII